jgi:hypothetical protein
MSWSERRRRTRDQTGAGALVGKVLESYGVDRDVREHRLVIEWSAIVGKRIAARTWPDGLSKGILWVRVSNSAWLQELSFLRKPIAQHANELCGDPPLVREVRLHIGARKSEDADDVVAALAKRVMFRRRRNYKRPTPATGAALEQIQRDTDAVDDEDLRAAIREARIKLGI